MKGFLSKCVVSKADLLQGRHMYCLQACMCAHFSPEILQAVAVKGLILSGLWTSFLHTYTQPPSSFIIDFQLRSFKMSIASNSSALNGG